MEVGEENPIPMQHDVRPLIEQLDDLLGQLDRVNAEAADMLADVHPEHRAGAENLLHYAHLRTIDIRELQNGLHDRRSPASTAVWPSPARCCGRSSATRWTPT